MCEDREATYLPNLRNRTMRARSARANPRKVSASALSGAIAP